MPLKRALGLLARAFALLAVAATAHAAEPSVGKVVAVKGTATISRGAAQVKAQVRGELLASDTVRTAAGSRAKLLFIDDSVITLSENSSLVVQEFIHSKGKEGRSIYNLLDGKMRSVVGKTKFEVRTPTAVAAARGTVIFFEVGRTGKQEFSRILCLEGKVEVRSVASGVRGMTLLTPGTMVTVKAGQSPPPSVKAPPAELEKARKATSSSSHGGEGSSGTAATGSVAASENGAGAADGTANGTANSASSQDAGPAAAALPAISGTSSAAVGVAPPVQTLPVKQPTRVNITIGIPGNH